MQFLHEALSRRFLATRLFYPIVAALALSAPTTSAQQANRTPTPERVDEIIRINTELVQTEVMVFDRQGRFVAGLRPEQFELSLNGTKQSISFFERVTAGSANEAAQLAAARIPVARAREPEKVEGTAATDRGRVVFFFLDDAHLGPSSLARARETLRQFVDDQMNANDQVAIVSTSGQIGFLQQLTDNPAVLRAAIARLNYKQNPEAYTGKTQISEYMATQVLDYGNRELYAYLLESIKVEQQSGPGSRHGDHRLAASYSAAPYLKNRLHQINNQGRMTTADTLDVLRSLIDSASVLPGRKLVFFLSDGFIVNERKAGALEALQRVTQSAARSGVVIYTMDLRGTILNLGSGVDASVNTYTDLSRRLAGLAMGEINATQEPLRLIADETGGRAILNTNSLTEGITQAINETSEYYLLAWRPDSADFKTQRQGKLRLRVMLKDRPDLRVQLRNNYYYAVGLPLTTSNKKNEAVPTVAPEVQLAGTLASAYPEKVLPVSLALGFLQTSQQGASLRISMQLDRRALSNNPEQKPAKAEVDVLGVAIDDAGQFSSFKQLLTISPESGTAEDAVKWNQQLPVKSGIYQVRVAVRERATGRTGSAQQWIEIPDTSQRRFSMSSLFLAERREPLAGPADSVQPIAVDVDHRFARTAVLRFQTYLYDATRGANGPEVWIQTLVKRNRQQVMSVAPVKVPITTNALGLPYWSEVSLDSLPAGRYVLQVLATDRLGNRSTSQQINFSVE